MRYFTPSPLHERLGLVCLGVGIQQGVLPAVGPRTLDHHVAVLVTVGTGWYQTPDRRRTTVTAPSLIWLTPGAPHHYASDPETGWDEVFVDFTGPATAAYTQLGYIEPDRPVVPLTDASACHATMARIARAARRDSSLLEVETAAFVHELLVNLRLARADTNAAGVPVLDALARDACLPLTVAQHAARHGMTPAELRAVVRRHTGRSTKDHLLSLRLGRARELLVRTDLPIAAIARRVGFDDPAYFSRLFTRRVGLAPIRYRERQGRTVPRDSSTLVPARVEGGGGSPPCGSC
ncbi:helix-turn-helix domain-containing protein [Streptomyces actinomycinicus]|uniref:Helix-turn-helix domain-containing protein n=1 Tax=Streptomyces actinomycinicus TaxID=1695166 RepID=A0A937JPS9_9ACTN|nr:helix-turn-helix domain-containing protein [Streptomyces actinomycinicus]MBL1083787.1 helix-turn-helix domain-containing protein [Streptomyces actinomycinicus]